MTRVENLGQTFPRIHTRGTLRTYHLLFRTSIPPERGGKKDKGGKIDDFLKVLLAQF